MSYKTIRQGDNDFHFVDGMALVPRAMLHVLPDCPANIRNDLQWAVSQGYVKVVASIPETELMWGKIQK
jgi:hypothetical protein